MRNLLYTLLLLAFVLNAEAQMNGTPANNKRIKLINTGSQNIQLDSLSIDPASFIMENADTSFYSLDWVNALLTWKRKPAYDSVKVQYRVFSLKLNSNKNNLSLDSVMQYYTFKTIEPALTGAGDDMGGINFGNIKASGSIGRGLGFGNNQDAVVTSTLKMELSGILADSIEVQAAISDDNIPIQPDGNTQELNEFDRVYLMFKKKGWQLNVGDIDVRISERQYFNFYKRLQGLSFETKNSIGKNSSSKTMASGAIAKGKFTRNIITALEGNQGPYKLQGANNELFFVILSNTERVFIDGELLQRGEDRDYIINYNTAEIVFMPKRMITKDSRIQVEFEYSDRNYLNANFFITQEFKIKDKWKTGFSAYTNQDNKNSSLNQELNAPEKQFLATLGDSVAQAFYTAAYPDTLSTDKILYEKTYINTPSGLDSFYTYSTSSNVQLYRLAFSYVGQGLGNYVPDFNGANGKVYKYVSPVGGTKQGSYEPAIFLVTPKQQQLFNFFTQYDYNKTGFVKAELGISNYDANTFSSVHDDDNMGYAINIQALNKKALKGKKWELESRLLMEWVNNNFKPLERLRQVEFTRDWGLPILLQQQREQLMQAGISLLHTSGNAISYKLTQYTRGDDYKGWQNSIRHQGNKKNWIFNNELVYTKYNTLQYNGNFFRPVLDVGYQFKNNRTGIKYAQENNKIVEGLTGNIRGDAFWFDMWTLYFKSNEQKKNNYGLNFYTRSDKYPNGTQFTRGDRSVNVNGYANLLANSNRRWQVDATYRKLLVYDGMLSKNSADNSLLGRTTYEMREWKGLLTGRMLYELGAGQEPKRDITYVAVPTGQGVYTWIDYNNDGIQQLNEFEEAQFADQRNYVRIFTPTTEYIKARYTNFNYSVNINPRSLLLKQNLKGWKKVLSNSYFLSSMQIAQKNISEGLVFNPFKSVLNDTSLLQMSKAMVNTFSYNRISTKWGFDVSNNLNTSKALLTYGYESMKNNYWTLKYRQAIVKQLTLQLLYTTGEQALLTPNSQFSNRNYSIDRWMFSPQWIFMYKTNLRITTAYQLQQKTNAVLYGGEKATSHSVNAEIKYNQVQSGAITGKLTYDYLKYTGNVSASTVSFIMLDALQPGKNLLWNIVLNKRLMNNLELNIAYDGRKPAGVKVIHTARVSVAAIF